MRLRTSGLIPVRLQRHFDKPLKDHSAMAYSPTDFHIESAYGEMESRPLSRIQTRRHQFCHPDEFAAQNAKHAIRTVGANIGTCGYGHVRITREWLRPKPFPDAVATWRDATQRNAS